MPIVLKPGEVNIKDPTNTYYMGTNVIAERTTDQMLAELQERGEGIVEDASDAMDAAEARAADFLEDLEDDLDAAETRKTTIAGQMSTATSQMQSAADGIEAQKNTMIASIASVAGQGTDTTMTQSGVAADAAAVGGLKSALNQTDTSICDNVGINTLSGFVYGLVTASIVPGTITGKETAYKCVSFEKSKYGNKLFTRTRTQYNVLCKVSLFNSSNERLLTSPSWIVLSDKQALDLSAVYESYPTTYYVGLTICYSTTQSTDNIVSRIFLDDLYFSDNDFVVNDRIDMLADTVVYNMGRKIFEPIHETFNNTTDGYWYKYLTLEDIPAYSKVIVHTHGLGSNTERSIAVVSKETNKVLYISTFTDNTQGNLYEVSYVTNEDCYVMIKNIPYVYKTSYTPCVRGSGNYSVGDVVLFYTTQITELAFDINIEAVPNVVGIANISKNITPVVLRQRDNIEYFSTNDPYWYRVKDGAEIPALYECEIETIGTGSGYTISIAFVSCSADKVLHIETITDSTSGAIYSVTYTPQETCYIMCNKMSYAYGSGLPTAVRTGQELTEGSIVILADYSTNVLKFDSTIRVKVNGNSIVRNSALSERTSKKELIVDINGKGDYTTIQAAVAAYEEGQEIVVYPGLYIVPNDSSIATSKTLIIHGVDRDTCIVRSYDGRYAYPAFNVAAGCFSNLTIEARYLSGTSHEGDGTETGGNRILAFALHSDRSASEGKTLTLSNCIFRSDFGHSVGVGLFKDMKFICENCVFINGETADHHGYFNGELGAVAFHNMSSNSTAGHCETFFKDCVMKSGFTYGMAIWEAEHLDGTHDLNRTMDCTFINNTLYTAESGFNCQLNDRGSDVFTSGSPITLNGISHGNTMETLNA